jgi:hypothetical protein
LQQPEADLSPITTGSVLREALRVSGRRWWRYLVLYVAVWLPVFIEPFLAWPWALAAGFVALLLLPLAEGAVAFAVLNEPTLRGFGLKTIAVLPTLFFFAELIIEREGDLASWASTAVYFMVSVYAVVAATVFYRRLVEIAEYA